MFFGCISTLMHNKMSKRNEQISWSKLAQGLHHLLLFSYLSLVTVISASIPTHMKVIVFSYVDIHQFQTDLLPLPFVRSVLFPYMSEIPLCDGIYQYPEHVHAEKSLLCTNAHNNIECFDSIFIISH